MSVESPPPAHQSPILKRARPISSSPSSGSTKSRISVKLGALFGRVVDWVTEHRTEPSRPIGENRAHKAIERARELKAKMHGLQTGLNKGTSLLSLTDEELKTLDTSVRDVGEEAKSIIKSFGAQRKYRVIIRPFSAMSEKYAEVLKNVRTYRDLKAQVSASGVQGDGLDGIGAEEKPLAAENGKRIRTQTTKLGKESKQIEHTLAEDRSSLENIRRKLKGLRTLQREPGLRRKEGALDTLQVSREKYQEAQRQIEAEEVWLKERTLLLDSPSEDQIGMAMEELEKKLGKNTPQEVFLTEQVRDTRMAVREARRVAPEKVLIRKEDERKVLKTLLQSISPVDTSKTREQDFANKIETRISELAKDIEGLKQDPQLSTPAGKRYYLGVLVQLRTEELVEQKQTAKKRLAEADSRIVDTKRKVKQLLPDIGQEDVRKLKASIGLDELAGSKEPDIIDKEISRAEDRERSLSKKISTSQAGLQKKKDMLHRLELNPTRIPQAEDRTIKGKEVERLHVRLNALQSSVSDLLRQVVSDTSSTELSPKFQRDLNKQLGYISDEKRLLEDVASRSAMTVRTDATSEKGSIQG